MATKSKVVGLKSTGADLLNAVRSSIVAGSDLTYADRIPVATQDNLQEIGKALLSYTPDMNQFLNELINVIGMQVIRNRLYTNKLKFLKRGFLEYGDTIEEIFVDIAKAKNYITTPPAGNEGDVFKQELPKVLSAFHKVNREDYYKVTINEAMLKRAFMGYAQFDSFVAGIFNSIYNADELDEYILFKQLIGEAAKNSYQVQVAMPVSTDKATVTNFSIQLRAQALNMEYMSRKYNQMGVATHTALKEQVLFIRSDVVPVIDVVELANAFNENLASPISGRIIVVDDFGSGNENYLAVITDSEFSMIYDTRFETNSIYNPQYLYWNYFLHHHQIISSSPFSNIIALTTGTVTPAVNSVVISPKTATVMQGGTQKFEATLDITGDVDTGVTYSVDKTSGSTAISSGTTIDNNGLLKVGLDEENTSLTVTVTTTSGSKTDTATVTVTPFSTN